MIIVLWGAPRLGRKHALYELDSVAWRFGGKYAKKRLVSTQPPAHIYLERAEEMGIEVL